VDRVEFDSLREETDILSVENAENARRMASFRRFDFAFCECVFDFSVWTTCRVRVFSSHADAEPHSDSYADSDDYPHPNNYADPDNYGDSLRDGYTDANLDSLHPSGD